MAPRAILKCRTTAVSRPKYFATRQTVRQKVLLPLGVDAVEKVPNCFAINIPPKDETRDDCSSICR